MTERTGSEVQWVQSSPSSQEMWNSYWMAEALKNNPTQSNADTIKPARSTIYQRQEDDVRLCYRVLVIVTIVISLNVHLRASTLALPAI